MQKGFVPILVLVTLLVFTVGAVGGFYFYNQQKIKSINSFEECSKYYPVMESYPAQCNTPDGRHFVQELSEEEKKKLETPKDDVACIQVITPAKNKKTGECRDFPTPCDVPEEWKQTNSCGISATSSGIPLGDGSEKFFNDVVDRLQQLAPAKRPMESVY